MKDERCKYANKICQKESSTCLNCETYTIYKENLNYMESYRKPTL